MYLLGPTTPRQVLLGLSIPAIGIHGTIAPSSIFHFQSHGCIRLHPDDIEVLFTQVNQMSPAESYTHRYCLTESEGRIFIEAHRDIYRKADVSLTALEKLAQDAMLSDQIDWSKAAVVLEQGMV